MKAIQNILAATDFSEAADVALTRATLLAGQSGASLTFLHVFNKDMSDRLLQWGIEKLQQPDIEKMALQALQDKCSALLASHGQKDQTIEAQVRAGSLIKTLSSAIDELSADLLVCAARGQSLFRHHLLGSTALRLLHTTDCPVLVVKAGTSTDSTTSAASEPSTRLTPYKKVLLAVDFSDRSRPGVELARALAPKTSLWMLHVTESPFEHAIYTANIEEVFLDKYREQAVQESKQSLRDLRDQFASELDDSRLLTKQGDAANTLIEQAKTLGCDLIVIGRHGTGMLQEKLLGSVAKQVLEASPVDVLVV